MYEVSLPHDTNAEVCKDMKDIEEEVNLLLVASAFFSHQDKRKLIKKLRKLRGVKTDTQHFPANDDT